MLDHLVAPPDGTVLPDGGRVRLLPCRDGITIRAAFWGADSLARGTVFLLQGRAEFIEKYGEVIAKLLARGFAVATLDWRGQGGSMRQLSNAAKGHVEDFDDYLLDLETVMRAAEDQAMPEPFFMLGHSTGGAIGLTALARGETRFKRAIFSSPLVQIGQVPSPRAARLLAHVLAGIGLSGFFVPGGSKKTASAAPFEGNPLTSDRTRYAQMQAWVAAEPRLAIGDPTIGWADATFTALDAMQDPAFGQANPTPILMVLAGADTIVDTSAAARLAQMMRGASAITIPGACHEILMESDARQALFWAAFDAFLGAPLATPEGSSETTGGKPAEKIRKSPAAPRKPRGKKARAAATIFPEETP